MTAAFIVRWNATASDDLLRLFDFLLDRAKTADDIDAAQEAIVAVQLAAEERLAHTPLIYRKAAADPFQRELIVPFGASGYVVLYEIEGNAIVNILAVRHQREDDYH
jgi:plasmid stabilization system protein ParE